MSEIEIKDGVVFKKDEYNLKTLNSLEIYDNVDAIKELGVRISKIALNPVIYLKNEADKIIMQMIVYKGEHKYQVKISNTHFMDYIIIDNVLHYLTFDFDFINNLIEESKIEPQNMSFYQYLSTLKTFVKNKIEFVDYVKDRLEQVRKFSPNDILNTDLNGTLFEYQNIGFNWLTFMYRNNCGAILADEMGLGKTLQIISLMTYLKHIEPKSHFLVICPLSLLENWKREIEKFSPNLKVLVHHGAKRTGLYTVLETYNVIITSYSNIQSDLSMFNMINWDLTIIDEAQNIKNPYANRTKIIKQIRSKNSIAVTGTPFENHIEDIWSIVDFVMPNYFGTLAEFKREYSDDIDSAELIEPFLSPLMIRRKVKDVAKDLPDRVDIPQPIVMDEEEATLYESNRKIALQSLSELKIDKIQKLRMFCTHPYVYNKGDQTVNNPSEVSAKYQRLCEIVEEIFSLGEKVLIFTSFNKMNSLLSNDLRKRFAVMTYSITGETNVSDRQIIIDEFTKYLGPAALILNPKAAGAGLNITAANHVIHYNLEWNPAIEDQASARAYRRGQEKTVFVYRLFYTGTIEEIINDRIERKREISKIAIVGNQGNMNDDDLEKALNISPIRR